jgi:S1-C subfamily serine protease
VAAIGSPFGEQQSLSVGIVSATDRDVDSLTKFQISGAIQTDAAINPGNSGGPLVDADGEVLGLNQQIETESGTSAGVGFAVPIDLAKRSIAQLREQGKVDYAFIGVSTTDVYPQLARKYDLGTDTGAWVQTVSPDGPADDAGIRAGSGGDEERFQAQAVIPGGDVITAIAGQQLKGPNDLGRVVARLQPGRTVPIVIERDGKQRTLRVKLAERPAGGG